MGGVREKSTGLFELLLHRVLGLTVSTCIVSLVLMCHRCSFQSLCRLGDVVWVWHLGWTVCSSAGERVDEEGKGEDFAEFTGLVCTAASLSDLRAWRGQCCRNSRLCIKAGGMLKVRNHHFLLVPFLSSSECVPAQAEWIVRAADVKVLVLLYGKNGGKLAQPWFHCHISLIVLNPVVRMWAGDSACVCHLE